MKDAAENRMVCEPYVGKFGQTYECSCGCHQPGVAMMHCAPCCHPCPVCEVMISHVGRRLHLQGKHADRVNAVLDEAVLRTKRFLLGLSRAERQTYDEDQLIEQNVWDLLYAQRSNQDPPCPKA